MDNKLARANAASVADAEFGYLKDAVTKSRPDVLRATKQVGRQRGVVLSESEGEKLLAVEARLIEDAKHLLT